MASTAGASQQYVDNSVREDLTDILTQLDPNETPFYADVQVGPDAIDVRHEVLTDTLNTSTDKTVAEANATSYATRVEPSRVANYCQIFEVPVLVSGTQQSVKHAAIADKFAYEKAKSMKELVIDIEKKLIRSSLNSGTASGTARRMNGMLAAITSNVTNASGVSLSETMLNNYLQEIYTDGGNADYILTSMTLKKRISGYTSNVTDYRSADEMKAGRIVNIYEADATSKPVRIVPSRYATDSTEGDTGQTLYILQLDTWAKSHLRRPFYDPRAKAGDYDAGVVMAELTLEPRAEKHNAKILDLS